MSRERAMPGEAGTDALTRDEALRYAATAVAACLGALDAGALATGDHGDEVLHMLGRVLENPEVVL